MRIETQRSPEFSPKPTGELSQDDFLLMAGVLDAQAKEGGVVTRAGIVITADQLTYKQFGLVPRENHQLDIRGTVTDIRANQILFVGPIRYQQLSKESQLFEVFEVFKFGFSYRMLPLLKVEDRELISLAYLGTEFRTRF